jgi:hypothetical protein
MVNVSSSRHLKFEMTGDCRYDESITSATHPHSLCRRSHHGEGPILLRSLRYRLWKLLIRDVLPVDGIR